MPLSILLSPLLYATVATRHELWRAERDMAIIRSYSPVAACRDIGPNNDAVLKFRQLWIEPGSPGCAMRPGSNF